ncbi:hypothetical protein H6F67_04285 [Microcoleus sp. FACHB-1515]|uniref:hypothetical protein n=1 Tax=Cyanophyceae TaxID=3028117 RepID=UPI00168540A5|nr:hypothetical protein [Microcoleus sp. FACHB-1515]MBD2089073.1 hypothetical protein [Microcoleus sp. FACHB-1515]
MSKARPRKSLSLRLQPYADSPLAEVIDYLNTFEKEDLNRKIGDILVMCLLPYARLHANELEADLRITCLEACDAMDKHASTMRQALRVPQLQFQPGFVSTPAIDASRSPVPTQDNAAPDPVDDQAQTLRPVIQDKDSIEAVDQLFG